ncbi:unnamed protein product [Pedinophyceae sp. YPF-701]|nr:unnamed protein product [Pedinophyceae sp. YPF-701]
MSDAQGGDVPDKSPDVADLEDDDDDVDALLEQSRQLEEQQKEEVAARPKPDRKQAMEALVRKMAAERQADEKEKKRRAPERAEDDGDDAGAAERKKKRGRDDADGAKKKKKKKKRPDGAEGAAADVDSENDEEGVANEEDRQFIEEDDQNDEDNRWAGGDSDDERGRPAEEAEEGEEDEAMEMPARKKTVATGGRAKPREPTEPVDPEIRRVVDGAFGKGRKKNEVVETEKKDADQIVKVFLARMEKAAKDDRAANEAARPAGAKVRLLPEVEAMLRKQHLQETFLNHGLLECIAEWLDLMPDRSLPNVRVRSSMLRVLKDLDVDLVNNDRREQMKRTNLGQLVMFLFKCTAETPENRRLASELVSAWFAQLGIGGSQKTSTSNLRKEGAEEREANLARWEAKQARAVEATLRESRPENRIGEEGFRKRAAVPRAANLDFKVKPLSDASADRAQKTAQRSAVWERLEQVHRSLRKPKSRR